MIEPEHTSETTPLESRTGELVALQTLRDEVRTLRSLFRASALALILLSFAINAYLYYQDRIVRRELEAAKRIAQEFETVKRPVIGTFINRLQEFSRSHPDINPILDKYGIRPAASAQTPAPSPTKNGK